VITPAVVIRPIEPLVEVSPPFANHNAPSGPAVMPQGKLMLGSLKQVTASVVLIRPISLPRMLVNHRAPSGPAVMARGSLLRPWLKQLSG
jgi:hypothetical protein